MKQPEEAIYLVSHDERVRQAVCEHLPASDREIVSFRSAAGYLTHSRPNVRACLILEMQLPDCDGLDLQRRLSRQPSPPIVFVSGDLDIPRAVQAMKAGAIDVLAKPLEPRAIENAVSAALCEDGKRRRRDADLTHLRDRYSALTPRERQVLPLVVGGLLNKQAAAVLGIAEVTLQVHRGQIMRKMAAESFAELVRMAEKLCVSVESASASQFLTAAAFQ